jgi:hypothetical protein
MNLLIFVSLALLFLLLVQSSPIFDVELVASPLIHDAHINYRGGKRGSDLAVENNINFTKA